MEKELTKERGRRKERVGIVASDKMQKTIIVAVRRRVKHPLLGKYMVKVTRCATHDEKNEARIGDIVRIMETRPLSKTKCWRLVEILRRAK